MRKLFLISSILFLVSCSNLQSYRVPGIDLSKVKSFYVVKTVEETSDIDRLIAEHLNSMGYHATYGPEKQLPKEIEAIVTYEDRWMWDITMYLLKLDINIMDGITRQVIAKGESYRPSLVRRTPRTMVQEILDEMLPTAN